MVACRTRWRIAVCLVAAVLPSFAANAANVTWSGATSTDFTLGGNWAGGVAPADNLTTDVGVFAGSVPANQPQLTGSRSITGLSFTTTTGGWTLGSNSSANVLALGASGITSSNTSGTNTISANLSLGATQTWQAGTGGTLRITGGVSSGSSESPSANGFSIGGGSNNGTVVFEPAVGSNLAIYSNATNQAITINKATAFGSAINSSSGTNVISHATSAGISVVSGGSLAVNSGVWQTNDIGRNGTGVMTGEVNLNGGTLAAGGTRFMLNINGTAAGQWVVNGGTLKVTGSSRMSNSSFQLGAGIAGTPSSSTVGAFNLQSGLVDVAKGAGQQNIIGGVAATNAPSVLMNQSGGVAQFGVTTGADVFTGVTNANTLNNLYIGAAGNATTGVKAAYTLSGGRLLVAGGLQGFAPTAGGGGVSNFNFMGGTLTAGTIIATNLGSSSTATSSANQVASSDTIGTLVNYGGVLAPGGDLLAITSDQYGNSSIAATPVSGRTAITGNYVVSGANAALATNLGGTTASSAFQDAANSGRFSNVTVSGAGANTLSGNLLVNLIPGSGGTTFAPTNANTFKIVSFTGAGATNSGTFAGNNVADGKAIATDGLTAFAITYDYTAVTGGVTLGSATTNQWNGAASGSNWNTAANWTALAANTSAFIARFADGAAVPTGANNVDLANNLTIQGIQLSSTSRQYTISSGNGSGLTLDASPRNTTNLMTGAATAATAQITDSSAGAGSHTIGVPLTLASDLAVAVNNAASTVTVSGNISGAGRSITKSGTGTLVLSGSNSYTGNTTVTGGTLSVASPNALPGWNTSGKVTLGTGVGLTITSAFGSSDLATLLTNVTFSGSNRLGIDTTSGNLTSSSPITDKGTGGFGLIKLGSGTLTLSAGNSYTGGTVIGTTSSATSAIVVQGDQSAATGGWTIGSPPSGRNTVTFDSTAIVAVAAGKGIMVGGTLNSSGNGAQLLSTSGSVGNAGTLYVGRNGTVTLNSGATWSQQDALTIAASGGATATVNVNAGSIFRYSGSSAITLNGVPGNSGSAFLNIASGTVETSRSFQQTAAAGAGTGSARVTLSGGGVLRITDSIDSLFTATAVPMQFVLGAGGGTIDTSGFNAGITVGGTGSGGLTKTGVGRLMLSGSNSFTGGTTINAGALIVNGALSGNVAIASGAMLGGSGVLGGTLSGAGTISVGNSPGIGTAAAVDPTAGTDWVFEITGTAPTWNSPTASVNDVLRLTDASPLVSSLTSGNAVDVLFDLGATPVAQGSYLGGFFIDNESFSLAGALTNGTFRYWVEGEHGTDSSKWQAFTVGAGGSAVTYSLLSAYDSSLSASYTITQQTVDFGAGSVTGAVTQFVIVPEPSTVAFAGIGIAMAGWSLWKRRQGR